MKNKKLLAVMLTIFKGVDEKQLIEAIDKEDGDDSVLKAFTEKHEVFSTDELDKIKKNAREEAVNAHFNKTDFDIDKDIPSPIAAKLLGRKLEGKQAALAKKYEVSDAKDIDDLIEKLVTKSKEGKGNPDQELIKQIDLLKQTVIDAETKVKEVENKYVTDEINRHFNDSLAQLSLDYPEEALPKQMELLQHSYLSQRKLDKKGKTIVVLDSKGERINDKLGDPLPISNDLTEFAKSYGFKFKEKEQGGRGDGSSQGAGASINYKGKNFNDVLAARNSSLPDDQKIKMGSDEMLKMFQEFEAANKN